MSCSAYCILWDCESDSLFAEYTDKDEAFRRMQITCICSLCIPLDEADGLLHDQARERVFWRDAPGDIEAFVHLLSGASFHVAFNGIHFDLKLLQKHCRPVFFELLVRAWDPMLQLSLVVGRWPKLDDLLEQNGLSKKTGDGVHAVRLWAEGRRFDLACYCMEDVRLLWRLCCLPELRLKGLPPVPSTAYSLAAAARLFSVNPKRPKVEVVEVVDATGAAEEASV